MTFGGHHLNRQEFNPCGAIRLEFHRCLFPRMSLAFSEVDHEFTRSFVGKLLRLGYPLLDARTSCKLPEYLSYVLGRSSGQLAIRLDARPIEAIVGSYADPADGGQMVRRTFIR